MRMWNFSSLASPSHGTKNEMRKMALILRCRYGKIITFFNEITKEERVTTKSSIILGTHNDQGRKTASVFFWVLGKAIRLILVEGNPALEKQIRQFERFVEEAMKAFRGLKGRTMALFTFLYENKTQWQRMYTEVTQNPDLTLPYA